MDFLPEGLSLVASDRGPLPVKVCQATADGPWFTVFVNRVAPKEFKKLAAKFATPAGASTKAAKQYQQKFEQAYCDAVISGWEGLTLDNFEEILATGEKVSGKNADKLRGDQYEIEHTPALALRLYQDSWADRFADPIFRAAKEGSDEIEDEIEEAGND